MKNIYILFLALLFSSLINAQIKPRNLDLNLNNRNSLTKKRLATISSFSDTQIQLDNKKVTLTIYDSNGKKTNLNFKYNSIDISYLKRGVYILKIVTDNFTITKRILKS